MLNPCCHFKVLSVLLLLLFMNGCTYLAGGPSRPPIPNVPRTYVADYNRVWNSALDTLDEMGYVIAQMDKADGYITTDRKVGGSYRDKVSLRIVVGREGEITVKVNQYAERRRIQSTDSAGRRVYDSWGRYSTNGHDEKWIKDKIAEKLGLAK